MSTLSAQFHTMGAAFGADAFPKLGRSKNPNSTLGVRIGVLCSILVSYVICYTLSASIIARGTALFMGICAATFLPTYFCSLYWKGATRQGALASLWVGGLASLFADSKEGFLAFLMNLKTLISIYSIDRYIENSTFALWFFHNSIRFKVNKVG